MMFIPSAAFAGQYLDDRSMTVADRIRDELLAFEIGSSHSTPPAIVPRLAKHGSTESIRTSSVDRSQDVD